MTSFDKAWRVVKGREEGYGDTYYRDSETRPGEWIEYTDEEKREARGFTPDDPICRACDRDIRGGEQHGCEGCGGEFCEECMKDDDQYGLPGYRGKIDSDHPAYEMILDRGGGPHCGECCSELARHGE